MAEKNPALYFQARSDHTAEGDRQLLKTIYRSSGVATLDDMKVTQHTPNMSVNVAAGAGIVLGTESAQQGAYHVWNDATKNLSIAPADLTNPRTDFVVARIKDAAYSGATNAFSLEVLTGNPAASPLDPTVPANCLTLASIRVDAAVSSIVTGKITNLAKVLRPWGAAWGEVASAERTSNFAGFGSSPTAISSFTLSATLVAGRAYKLSGFFRGYGSTAANITVQLYDNTAGAVIQEAAAYVTGSGTDATWAPFKRGITGSGAKTYTVLVSAGAGTGTIVGGSTRPMSLILEDVGPA